jgi:hypothetical protein
VKASSQPWCQQIEEKEIARERGKIDYALQGFSTIRSNAAEARDLDAVALATAQIVICYKHLFQNTGMPAHRMQMENELSEP